MRERTAFLKTDERRITQAFLQLDHSQTKQTNEILQSEHKLG